MTELDNYKGSTVAIMQPYFFPYLGYFSLIKHTDYWIVFDPVQYRRRGWMNRNRILAPEKPNGGWQYISIPVKKAPREALIRNIRINYDTQWQNKILRQIEHYRKKAPFFNAVNSCLVESLNTDKSTITSLNTHLLNSVCKYLSIPFNYAVYSDMNFPDVPVNQPGDWALDICKHLEVATYINPPGGEDIFSKDEWHAQGINLKFLSSQLPYYSQRREESIMGLSIIDIMMFNSPEDISAMLDEITIT